MQRRCGLPWKVQSSDSSPHPSGSMLCPSRFHFSSPWNRQFLLQLLLLQRPSRLAQQHWKQAQNPLGSPRVPFNITSPFCCSSYPDFDPLICGHLTGPFWGGMTVCSPGLDGLHFLKGLMGSAASAQRATADAGISSINHRVMGRAEAFPTPSHPSELLRGPLFSSQPRGCSKVVD